MIRRFIALAAVVFSSALVADTTLVPTGATWRYLDTGTDQGTAWRAAAFDDSTWPAGPAQLGYGDGDEATVVSYGPSATQKFITTYFRHSFSVADPAALGGLTLHVLRDDGAVVYLNGTEVWRSNMPAGAVSYTTLASTPIGGSDESLFHTAAIDPSLLVAGTNVLGVEIHQADPASTDISFDLELIGTPVVVTRGPYLQLGTSSSIHVRWRTSSATNSQVRYGTTAANLDATAGDAMLTTDHDVQLSALSAATTYYYSVGTTSGTLAGDSSYFFVTSPVTGTTTPARIWVLGDSGTADNGAAAVRNAYENYAGSTYTNLWLMLGDNAYFDGTDAEYQSAVFAMYPAMLRKSVLWPAIGNHDTAQSTIVSPSLPYFQMFTLPAAAEAGGVASGTEKYYSFDYANIHFVCLDSMSSDRSSAGPMLTWLQNDLAATTQQWIVAYWHHPPYSKGSHDSDVDVELKEMRENALPILEDYGVDLVLAGHSHSYERSYLIDSHYGLSGTFTSAMKKDGGSGREGETGAYRKAPAPHNGAVYAVAGSSGHIAPGALNHPAMFISMSSLGSVVLDVAGNRLDARFLRETGAIDDSFTILKGVPAVPAGVSAHATGAGEVTVNWTTAAAASGYQIERRGPGGAFTFAGTSTSTMFVDGSASPGTAYLYRVIATNSAGSSAPSAADLATAVLFTDDPLVPLQTRIKAAHLGELRTAANAVRALAGLSAQSFTGPSSAGTAITATQIGELRAALDEALPLLGLPAGGWANAVAPNVLVKANTFDELRSRVK